MRVNDSLDFSYNIRNMIV